MAKISTRDSRAISKKMAEAEDFKTHGALSGRSGRFTSWDSGQLPREWVESFTASDYAVFSYATPIAWRLDGDSGEWCIPNHKYSQTTSCHQGKVRVAASLI